MVWVASGIIVGCIAYGVIYTTTKGFIVSERSVYHEREWE